MGELDYVGFMAMLWILFSFITVYFVLTDKDTQRASAVVSFRVWFLTFWFYPVVCIDEFFGLKWPKWMGPVIWFAPFYVVAFIRNSQFLDDGSGWSFLVGRLLVIWVY